MLLPIELNRVIYLDPAQIVRADLSELVKMDLNKSIWGFVPMCTATVEDSEWPKTMKVPKYYNTEFFVSDYPLLRNSHVIDWLRVSYHRTVDTFGGNKPHLSQDLPNEMQGNMRYFTLDRAWLWCHSWCDPGAIRRAKIVSISPDSKTGQRDFNFAKTHVAEWNQLSNEVLDIQYAEDFL
jgi:UDP-glucose:glycoprotein glucosyltransferase